MQGPSLALSLRGDALGKWRGRSFPEIFTREPSLPKDVTSE
jgi:hypothetical protein